MRIYRYLALDAEGRKQQGELEADGERAAVSALQTRGLMVLNVRRGSRILGVRTKTAAFKGASLVAFTQQLATLINAGQPLDRALESLLKPQKSARARELITHLKDTIKAGEPLSSALALHPETFSAFYVSLVRAGETGGVLDVTLNQLSEALERSHALKNEVINASIYPLFLVAGVLGSVVLLLSYVVPQFVPIFRDLGVALPLVTRAIMAVSTCLDRYGLQMAAGLSLALMALSASRRRDAARLAQDRRVLTMRVIGPLMIRLETARLARTLATLLNNGVTLASALVIARDVSANRAIRTHVESVTAAVKEGVSLSRAMQISGLMPELLVQMVEVGEQAGTLGPMLARAAEVYDIEARRTIERLMAALAPTLTIVMTMLVAAIMLAIMLPLMSLTSHV